MVGFDLTKGRAATTARVIIDVGGGGGEVVRL